MLYVIDSSRGTIVLFHVAQAEERRLRINGPECSCHRPYLVQRFVELKACSDPKHNFMFEVTKSFKVYKLMTDAGSSFIMRSVNVQHIGDELLFVGDSPSVTNVPCCAQIIDLVLFHNS